MFDDPSFMPSKAPMNLMKQQRLAGGIAGGVGGLLGLYGQGASMMQQANQYQTNAPGAETNAYGKPEFNLNGFTQQVDAMKPQGASAGEIGSGALAGAQTGAEIGSIIPGVGTFVGAGVGAVVGGLSNAITGGARKREEQRKKELATANLRSAQMQYNSSMVTFNNSLSAQSQYNDAMNTDARFQNIIKANNPNA